MIISIKLKKTFYGLASLNYIFWQLLLGMCCWTYCGFLKKEIHFYIKIVIDSLAEIFALVSWEFPWSVCIDDDAYNAILTTAVSGQNWRVIINTHRQSSQPISASKFIAILFECKKWIAFFKFIQMNLFRNTPWTVYCKNVLMGHLYVWWVQ